MAGLFSLIRQNTQVIEQGKGHVGGAAIYLMGHGFPTDLCFLKNPFFHQFPDTSNFIIIN